MPYGQTDPDTRGTLHKGIARIDLHPLYDVHPHCILSTRDMSIINRSKNTRSFANCNYTTTAFQFCQFLLAKLKYTITPNSVWNVFMLQIYNTIN